MALNTSAIYLGQAVGAAGGGAVVAAGGGAVVAANVAHGASPAQAYDHLHWIGFAWILVALGLSTWAHRALQRNGGRA
jgi:hypothetical protein